MSGSSYAYDLEKEKKMQKIIEIRRKNKREGVKFASVYSSGIGAKRRRVEANLGQTKIQLNGWRSSCLSKETSEHCFRLKPLCKPVSHV